jgi:hypothetical protein
MAGRILGTVAALGLTGVFIGAGYKDLRKHVDANNELDKIIDEAPCHGVISSEADYHALLSQALDPSIRSRGVVAGLFLRPAVTNAAPTYTMRHHSLIYQQDNFVVPDFDCTGYLGDQAHGIKLDSVEDAMRKARASSH